MSVQTQIDRINNEVNTQSGLISQIKAVLATKQSGSGSSGGDSSSSGGGFPLGITALNCGTFVPSSDISSNFNVEHGLGAIPNFFLVYADGEVSHTNFLNYIAVEFGFAKSYTSNTINGKGYKSAWYANANAFAQTASVATGLSSFANGTTFIVYAASNRMLKAGVTYHWIAGIVDGM